MMSRSSLEQYSIFYYLKEGVFSREFSEEVSNEPLAFDKNVGIDGNIRTDYRIVDPALSTYNGLPVTPGRGWVSFNLKEPDPCKIFDVNKNEYVSTYSTPYRNTSFLIPSERETDLVVVKDQYGDPIPRAYYQIDYNKGRIRWPAPNTPSGVLGFLPTTVDYRFHMIALVDGYDGFDTPPDLPAVALFPNSDKGKEIQLGGGVEFERRYSIEVFAANNLEKKNILDTIHSSLYKKSIPVIDFNRTGEPLTHWGVVNPDFIQEVDYNGSKYRSYFTLNPGNGNVLYFLDIEVLYNTQPRRSRSDIFKHCGRINFSTCTFTDRDPELLGKFSTLEEPPGGFDSLMYKRYSA